MPIFLLEVCKLILMRIFLNNAWNSVVTGVTGHQLYWIMWEAMCRLEGINLKVQYLIRFTFKGGRPCVGVPLLRYSFSL